jgi:hypothetical protein
MRNRPSLEIGAVEGVDIWTSTVNAQRHGQRVQSL